MNIPRPKLVFVLTGLVLAIAGVTVYSLANPDATTTSGSAQASIAWTPSSLEAVVSPAQKKTVVISFVASRNVRKASIEISPNLDGLIRAEPTNFERIRKGKRLTLNLMVAPAANKTLGTVTGTIQLRRGKADKNDPESDEDDRRDAGKLLPQPLKVVIHVAGVGTAIILPPDPGEDGKATLQGIDSDGDGVRDDVQRYIALNFANSAKTRAALTQVALALETELTGTSAEAQGVTNAMDCLNYTLMTSDADVLGGKTARDAFLSLRAVVLNTPERAKAFFEADSRSGPSVSFSTPYSQKASRCLLSPSLFAN